jgi:hypothetical protein
LGIGGFVGGDVVTAVPAAKARITKNGNQKRMVLISLEIHTELELIACISISSH